MTNRAEFIPGPQATRLHFAALPGERAWLSPRRVPAVLLPSGARRKPTNATASNYGSGGFELPRPINS
jgi:hypothetical protein